ncbi:wee1-like protein kinase isoform X2 [Dunckerocampus dactyliophorus]|uniref:wee1-like protein kinase isoform X2 n=1 Tax=Dunckerocampus dactyliophorus TaxID=161453 RepID=UPI0024074EA7|nr:wee1-like protein kinase isoform X2 [Dunckerocampus dactyliophorus]
MERMSWLSSHSERPSRGKLPGDATAVVQPGQQGRVQFTAFPDTPRKTVRELRIFATLHTSESLLPRVMDSPSARGSLFKNVEPAATSIRDRFIRRQSTPLVNWNPFSPDSLLVMSATQQRNNGKKAHRNVSIGEDMETSDAEGDQEILPASKLICSPHPGSFWRQIEPKKTASVRSHCGTMTMEKQD